MNKFILSVVFFTLMHILSSCDKPIPECDRFENYQLISEDQRSELCRYQRVYIFREEYYSVLNCCFWAIPAVARDCNGRSIFEFQGISMTVFYDEAEYIYSATEEE